MDLKMHTMQKGKKLPKCPECGQKLQGLYFMGTVLDGYVCPSCKAVVDIKSLKVMGRSF